MDSDDLSQVHLCCIIKDGDQRSMISLYWLDLTYIEPLIAMLILIYTECLNVFKVNQLMNQTLMNH
jgi:hypothetical protein